MASERRKTSGKAGKTQIHLNLVARIRQASVGIGVATSMFACDVFRRERLCAV
jgi:hypothetical protein